MRTQTISRSSAQASLVARQWADHLMTMAPGDIVTYTELAAMGGEDPQARRDLLDTARKIAQELRRKVFDVLTNEGLVCLSEAGKIGLNAKRLKHTNSINTKSARIAQTVDMAELTPMEKMRYYGQQAAIMVVHFGSSEQGIRHLEQQTPHTQITVNPEDYRGLFQGL